MDNLVDVHCLHLPHEHHGWAEQCRQSLRNEPIVQHHGPGVIGNVGAGRACGFTQGELPYVSYVDPDDWVLPGGFAACAKILQSYPKIAVVGTREYRVSPKGEIKSFNSSHPGPHHLLTFRRNMIQDELAELATLPHAPELWLLQRLKQRFGHHALWLIDEPYYVWRIHDQGWHLRTRAEHGQMMRHLRETSNGLGMANECHQ